MASLSFRWRCLAPEPTALRIRNSWADDNGRWYAAPWQVVLDCYSSNDGLSDSADRILDTLLLPMDDKSA